MSQGNNLNRSYDSNAEIIVLENFADGVIEISDDEDNNDVIDLSHIIEAASDEDIDDIRCIFKEEYEEADSGNVNDNCNTNFNNCIINPSAIAHGNALKRKHNIHIEENENQENICKRTNTNGSSTPINSNEQHFNTAQESNSNNIGSDASAEDITEAIINRDNQIIENTNQQENINTADNLECLRTNTTDPISNTAQIGNQANNSLASDISSDILDCFIIKQEETPESVLSISNSSIKSESDCSCSTTTEQTSRMDTSSEVTNYRKRKYNYDLSKLKWLRPLSSLSSPAHLQIVIIDRSQPQWRIPNDKWLMIEKRLLEELHDEMLRRNDSSIGLFDGAKWSKGIKVVGCHNENSLDFITKFILNIDKLWIGANLDVIPINLLAREIVRVYIPPPAMKTDTVISLIKMQNPTLCCDDWEIIREREKQYFSGGRTIWFSIDSQSLEFMLRSRGEVKYGINRIWFKRDK